MGANPHAVTGAEPHPRSNNMTPHIAEEFFTRLIEWSAFTITGNMMPPRNPDEDEDEDEYEDDDEEGREEEEHEGRRAVLSVEQRPIVAEEVRRMLEKRK